MQTVGSIWYFETTIRLFLPQNVERGQKPGIEGGLQYAQVKVTKQEAHARKLRGRKGSGALRCVRMTTVEEDSTCDTVGMSRNQED